jgi:hypothetical protein
MSLATTSARSRLRNSTVVLVPRPKVACAGSLRLFSSSIPLYAERHSAEGRTGNKKYGSKAVYDRLRKAAKASDWINANLRKRAWEVLAVEVFGCEPIEEARTAL